MPLLRFRAFRAVSGVSQQEMAEAIGVDPSSLSLILTGKRTPSVVFADRFLTLCEEIAEKHDVPPELVPTLRDLAEISPAGQKYVG